MVSSTWLRLFLLATLCLRKGVHLLSNGDPTEGFVAVPLTELNMEKQWPYKLSLCDRYSYIDGSEIRICVIPLIYSASMSISVTVFMRSIDFGAGNRDMTTTLYGSLRGYGFMPNGANGASIVQIQPNDWFFYCVDADGV